jgi:endonuclease/exonuclease/phosphatase family metal-dependent hydrolase
MRRVSLVLASVLVVAACAPDAATGPDVGPRFNSSAPPDHSSAGGRKDVRVMTRNLYLGASLNGVIGARSLEEAIVNATIVWGTVQASDIPARMERIADEIAAARPDLVGLQEVSLWRTGPADSHFPGGGTPATVLVYDFLDLLLAALAARGEQYVVVTVSTNIDAELPVLDPDGSFAADVRMTDRDVIIARHTVKTKNAISGNYFPRIPLTIGTAPGPQLQLVIPRGWNATDVKFRGEWFRFVNTHLEVDTPEIFGQVQTAQADELRRMLVEETLPVILVGDINSNGEVLPPLTTPSYALLRGAGFADAWEDLHPEDPGFTSGHDEDLRNPVSDPTTRIDVIFHRGPISAIEATTVGGDPAQRTAAGLWPSDHLGVIATLRIGNARFDE